MSVTISASLDSNIYYDYGPVTVPGMPPVVLLVGMNDFALADGTDTLVGYSHSSENVGFCVPFDSTCTSFQTKSSHSTVLCRLYRREENNYTALTGDERDNLNIKLNAGDIISAGFYLKGGSIRAGTYQVTVNFIPN